jgi:short-subunit dehydrogenase
MKVIVITGASGGIGAALARTYARHDTILGLLGRNTAKLSRIKKDCEARGAEVITTSIDVRDTEPLQDWLTHFNQQHPIDLLIANAGVTSSIGANGEPESWKATQNVLDVNFQGVIASIHPLIQPMQQRHSGQIAIISSLAAYRGLPVTPSYCASKAGIKSYGEALRGWLSADGIKVSVVCPGFVESSMSQQFPGNKPFLMSADKAAHIIKKGLDKNRARISFPFPLNLGTWFLAVLPASLGDFILRFFNYGSRRH